MSTQSPGAAGMGDLFRVLVESAEAFLERGADADALRCSEQVLQLDVTGNARGRALRVKGRVAMRAGRWTDALPVLRDAIEIHAASGDFPRAAECSNDLGESLRRAGDLEGARDALSQSLQYSASLRPGSIRATALEELGTVLRVLGDTARALDTLAEAKRIREAQQDPAALARTSRSFGNALYQAGRFDESLEEHRTSLAIAERLGDQLEIAMALNNVGLVQIQLGANDDADRSLRRAHGIFHTLHQPKMVAFAATNLALLASYRGDTADAKRRLEEVLEIQSRTQTKVLASKTLNNLANVAIMAGDPRDAIHYAGQAITFLVEAGRTEGLSAAWFSRGRACLELGQWVETEEAITCLQELVNRSSNRETECEALLLSAELSLARENAPSALETALLSRELAEAADLPRHEAEAARLCGEARMRTGDESQAREDLLVAERAFKELQSQYYLALSRLTLGRLFIRAGAFEAAANRLRAAVESSQRMGHDQLHWRSLLALAEAQWPISRRLSRTTLGEAESLARTECRTDREVEVRALREDLSAAQSGTGDGASTQTIIQLAKILRGAASGDDAIRGFLRTIHEILELESAAFFPAKGLEGLGRTAPATVHPPAAMNRIDGLAEGVDLDAWLALTTIPPQVVPVLGSHDLEWGVLVLSHAEPGSSGTDAAAQGRASVLQAAADILGLALDSLVSPPGSRSAQDVDRLGGANAPKSSDPKSSNPNARTDSGIIGESPRILAILDTVEKVATSDSSVLVLGESGTGKELIARELHRRSGRASSPFEAIACPSIPRELIEAELFGHEKGAFTGADRQRAGRIELANGGTLFLDEIGDIDLATQSKLLRFLQEREFSRVGGRETVRVNVRIVAATSRKLEQEIEEGRFREDLYYRLGVVPIVVPPLRERGDDVVRIAVQLLEELSHRAGKELAFAPATLDLLRRYPWPGNVRELRNLVEYLVAVSSSGRLSPAMLPERIRESQSRRDTDSASGGILRSGETLDARLMTLEGELIRRALEAASGNQSEAARLLGITETKLRHRMRRYGLATPRTRTRRAGRAGRAERAGRGRTPSAKAEPRTKSTKRRTS